MKKLKLLFIALLSCFCCFAFSGCTWLAFSGDITALFLMWALDEDKNAPTEEELRMVAEITEGAVITEITLDEDGWYIVKVEGAIKNLGEKDADRLNYTIAYYDENGYLLDAVVCSQNYVGAGDTVKVQEERSLFYRPESVRIYNVELYAEYDYSYERDCKEKVELVAGESFSCELGEDGLYHATVTGQVKLLAEEDNTVNVYVAFYDAEGYLHTGEWCKSINNGPTERTYVVEYISDVEIVSYKILYGATDW